MEQPTNRRFIFVIIALVIVAVLGIGFLLRSSGSGSLNLGGKGTARIIFNLPDTDKIKANLNGKDLKIDHTNQTFTLDSKQYTLKVTRPGYKTFTATFTVSAGKTTVINVFMQRDQSAQESQITQPNQIKSIGDTLNNMKVLDAQYFYQKTWAFVTLQIDGNTAYVVVKYNAQTSQWDIANGPGTSFSSNTMQDAPSDIYNYMQQNGYLYQEQEE